MNDGYILFGGEKREVPFPIIVGRNRGMWWEPNDQGARPRGQNISSHLVALHHTGGEGDAQRIFRTLWDRELSVHFTIGPHATLTQHADPVLTVTQHVKNWNDHFLAGIEIANRAVPPSSGRVPRDSYEDEVHGGRFTMLRFTPMQVGMAFDLCKWLTDNSAIDYAFPTTLDKKKVFRKRMTDPELLQFNGIVGHYHCTTKKWDPVPHLLDDLCFRSSTP